MRFQKATRQKAKLRMALTGVSGAGKTLGALYVAYGITGDWDKIALIDTEHERARFYANRDDLKTGAFLWAPLDPPYSPDKYINLINEAAQAVGPDGVVIVDSLSHGWKNEGGVLDIKDQIVKNNKGKNDFTAWNDAGRLQNRLINAILSVNCHTICTMRSKMEYVIDTNENGKSTPRKIGLAPVQREDTEYEFDIVLDIARNHNATASKDTTFLDVDGYTEKGLILSPSIGEELKKWLDSGIEPVRCEICGQVIKAGKGRTVE